MLDWLHSIRSLSLPSTFDAVSGQPEISHVVWVHRLLETTCCDGTETCLMVALDALMAVRNAKKPQRIDAAAP